MYTGEVIRKAEKIANKYNPEGLSPFPFDKIQEDKKDLNIYLTDDMKPGVSGIIYFDKNDKTFNIFINKSKSEARIQFTIAHELGHYFLHSEEIKSKKAIVDGDELLDGNRMLYSLDVAETSRIEIEANNFAAILIMPERFVKSAWSKLQSVEECAKVFNVSVSIMSIRLEKLNLI